MRCFIALVVSSRAHRQSLTLLLLTVIIDRLLFYILVCVLLCAIGLLFAVFSAAVPISMSRVVSRVLVGGSGALV